MNYEAILGYLFLVPLLYEIPFFIYFVKNRHRYPFHDRLPTAVICLNLIVFESIVYNSSKLIAGCWNGLALVIFGWPISFLTAHIYTYRIVNLLFAFEIHDDIQSFTQQLAHRGEPESINLSGVKELNSNVPSLNWFTRHRSLMRPTFIRQMSVALVTGELLVYFALEFPDYGDCTGHTATDLFSYFVVLFYLIIMVITGYKFRKRHDGFFLKLEFYYAALTGIGVLIMTVVLTLFGLDRSAFQIGIQVWAHINTFLLTIYPCYLCCREEQNVAKPVAAKSWSLGDILDTSSGYDAFSAFLQTEFSGENLLFWSEVQSYKKSQASEVRDKAFSIYDQFLSANAPFPINIPGTLRTQLLQEFDFTSNSVESSSTLSSIELTSSSSTPLSGPRRIDENTSLNRDEKDEESKLFKLFDPIQEEIYNLMASDTFYRFQRTDDFFKLKAFLSEQYRNELGTMPSREIEGRSKESKPNGSEKDPSSGVLTPSSEKTVDFSIPILEDQSLHEPVAE